jgi:transcriptional regulator of nitric oxide reductase
MRLIRVSFSSLHNVTKQLVKTGHGNAIGGKLSHGKADASSGATVNLLNQSFLRQKQRLANPQARINRQTPMKSQLIGHLSVYGILGQMASPAPKIGL